MNPLEQIMDWYVTARDAIRVTERVITSSIVGAITEKHKFHAEPPPKNLQALESSRNELDNMVVFLLVAATERLLREHIFTLLDNRFAPGNLVEKSIGKQAHDDAEQWKFRAELLPVFVTAPENLRGRVKQLVEFRDWVAHGHQWGTTMPQSPVNVVPKYAFDTLKDFLATAGVI